MRLMSTRWRMAPLLGVCLLAACDLLFKPPEVKLSDAAIALNAALPEDLFLGTLAGQQVQLIAHDCEVYSFKRIAGGEVEWTSVLALEPYPFFTSCERQSLTFDANPRTGAVISVTATLGRRAFGSGGCCARGGTYRTTDGRTWKEI